MRGLNSATGTETPEIFGRMAALADPIRCRLLLTLGRHELTVSEICSVLQLPQSTASRHLKLLADGGWVAVRREGTHRYYAARAQGLDAAARRLWGVIGEQVAASAVAARDRQRLEAVLDRRRARSQEFFASAAGRWTALRQELFGRRFDLPALMGLLDPQWTVGDLGCGTGRISEQLAPFLHRVVAVDESEAMLEAAARRLEGIPNVELRRGRLETLPLDDGCLDAATLVLVLHHLAEPDRVLAEAARVLGPGGRLALVDMLPHDREEYRRQMGHVWLGFSEDQLGEWLEAAGFDAFRFRSLPADPEANGPSLFAASAARTGSRVTRFPRPEGAPARSETRDHVDPID